MYAGQFFGEDEAEQLQFASGLIDAIPSVDIVYLIKFLAIPVHPPLRYFLSIPGLLLFPHSEFGLRFGATLVSLYMTYQVMQLGKDLGGEKVGFVSGALIAISPVYNWTSMAFGWSVIVVALLHCVRLLRSKSLGLQTSEGRKVFFLVNSLVIVAFLVNTGCILFLVSTGLVYLLQNTRHIGLLIKLFTPFVAFFALYYFVYLVVIPYVAATYFNVTTPFGQLQQNLARASLGYLNYTSFLENLKGINAYFFPYVSWVILICATYYLVRYEWVVTLWLSLFPLAWSFYLTNTSHQYFLLVFITIVPFGVKVIHDKLGPRLFTASMVTLAILMALWNYQIFLKPYGSADPNYPVSLIRAGKAELSRFHNISEPYDQIGADINNLLDEGKYFVHDLSGSFTMFYYSSDKYAGQLSSQSYPYVYDQSGHCYRIGRGFDDVGVIVTYREICLPSDSSKVLTRRTYPNSKIKLFLVSSRR